MVDSVPHSNIESSELQQNLKLERNGIKVICRVRPLRKMELEYGDLNACKIIDDSNL